MKRPNELKSELSEIKLKYGDTLNALNLKLEYSIESTLSKHDQIIEYFKSDFNLPVELSVLVLSHFSIPYLHKTLGANHDQLVVYVKNTGFVTIKSQLMKIGGYEIRDNGSINLICRQDVTYF